MRIAIGADHAGFPLKQHMVATLQRLGHQVEDRGTHSEASVDYPPICVDVARRVAAGDAERGIVIGGSGQGEQITANKVRGIRAALCNDLYTARMSRQHNDANVLAMGGRVVAFALADEIGHLAQHLPQARRAGEHGVGDAGQARDERRHRAAGIDQRRPFGLDAVALELYGADFDDAVLLGIEPGRLQIERDQRRGL